MELYLKIEDLLIENPIDVSHPRFYLKKLEKGEYIGLIREILDKAAMEKKIKLDQLDNVELVKMVYGHRYNEDILFGEIYSGQMPVKQGRIKYDGEKAVFQNLGINGTHMGGVGSGQLEVIGGTGKLQRLEEKEIKPGDQIYIGHPGSTKRYRITLQQQ